MKSGCSTQEAKKPRSIELPVLKNQQVEDNGIRRSKTARWRAAALVTLNVLMIAHIIQWSLMGTTVSPIEPSEAMHTLQTGAINAGAIFFSLAILATLIFGRFVCGWACHIVALQDFCAWLLKKVGLTPKPFRSRLLIFVPLIVGLYMFVWPTVYRLIAGPPNQPIIPQFTNHIITTDFWATFPPVWVAIPFLFICGFLTVYFLGQKGFCTYACPYGGFFAVADKVAPMRIHVTDACNQCGHCTATCMSNVQVHAEVKQYGMVIDPGCMKHMDCISVCPNDALYLGFGKPAVAVKQTITKNHSLSWPEEIFAAVVFFVSFLAVWDVYQLVPMLMALGIATITTFLAVRVLKLFRASDLSFYRWRLKSAGKIQTAGLAFLSFAVAWIGLNAHSGYVRWHERAGAIAYENIRIPDELALARANPARWLGASDRDGIINGRYHFNAARNSALFVNKEALSKLAWIEYLAGNTEEAIRLLDLAAQHQDVAGRALSLYYRGAILNRTGRYEEALQNLETVVAEMPGLITAREEKGESLWQLRRVEEAISVWSEAVAANPNLPLATSFLSGASSLRGDVASAARYGSQADQLIPSDPLFHWTLGLRLENLGMKELAEKHFAKAIQLNPEFRRARTPAS